MAAKESLLLLSAALLLGCGYRPGSLYAVGPHGHRADIIRLGCLDVAVVAVVDEAAHGPVAGYRFANRCDQPMRVDLAAVRASVAFDDGHTSPVRVYDPHGRVRAGVLDPRSSGMENLEYVLPYGNAAPTRLCLDLSRLNASTRTVGPRVQTCVDAHANELPAPTVARRAL